MFEESDWEVELDSAVGSVFGLALEVGRPKVLRHIILELLGKSSLTDFEDDYIGRAVEISLYDPEAKAWSFSSDEMRELKKAMKKVDAVFEKHENAASELRRQGKRN